MTDLELEMPDLQVSFAFRLTEADTLYLRSALAEAVANTRLTDIDKDLAELAPNDALQRMATKGMRGELAFPTPCILSHSPRLLAYYRMLLGYSHKSFYGKGTGLSKFKALETSGNITSSIESRLKELCAFLSERAGYLVSALDEDQLTSRFLEDLTIMTLGPQLRGGKNNQIGGDATREVFDIIHAIVRDAVVDSSPHHLSLTNAAGRKITIKFAADPDIIIEESIGSSATRKQVAIEIKGGTDVSNLYNRLGEAEKSHQKARNKGFVECWTVVNVADFDEEIARQNTPSTNQFFVLNRLKQADSAEYVAFRDLISSHAGIK